MNYVTVSWQGNADSYDIYRNDSLIVNVTDTIFVDNFSMQQGPTYHYNIKAINNTGCESALSDTVWFAIIGVEDINIENTNIQAKLYPNPTNDKSTLEIEGLTSEADVMVYDMVGRLIQKHKVNQSTKHLELDMRGNEKGIYFVRIVNDSIKHTKKLIVQ
jgi:fibronectin type 3 domain-containing protein